MDNNEVVLTGAQRDAINLLDTDENYEKIQDELESEELSEDSLEVVSGGVALTAAAIATIVSAAIAGVTSITVAGINYRIQKWDRKHKKITVCSTTKNGRTQTCTVSYK